MKKILTTLVLVLVFVLGGKAQSSFHVAYQHSTVQAKDQEGSRCNSNGAIIGYQYRVHAKSDIPLYIILGAEFNWNWSREHYSGDKEPIEDTGIYCDWEENYKTNYGGIKIPVSFAYEIQVSKSVPLYIIPQIGIHAYCNFSAHQDFDGVYTYYKDKAKKTITEREQDSYNLISSHDLGVYSYHRIVAGWQIGCSVRYGHYILGGTFEQELMHLTDYGHSSTFTIKLGYEL